MTLCFMCNKLISKNVDGGPFMTLPLPLVGNIAVCSQRCADSMLSNPAQPKAVIADDGLGDGSLWLNSVGDTFLAEAGSDHRAMRLALGWNALRGYSDELIERMTEHLKKKGK